MYMYGEKGKHMETPDKTKIYELVDDGSQWKIWEDENFYDDNIILYETEMGEEMIIRMSDFEKRFKEVVD